MRQQVMWEISLLKRIIYALAVSDTSGKLLPCSLPSQKSSFAIRMKTLEKKKKKQKEIRWVESSLASLTENTGFQAILQVAENKQWLTEKRLQHEIKWNVTSTLPVGCVIGY